MLTSDREVFEKLVTDTNHPDFSNYLTYALFASDRRDWIAYMTAETGDAPGDEAIAAWTSNVTPSTLDQLRTRAATIFDVAAQDYMAPAIEQARQETLQSSVLREVSGATEAQKAGLAATLAEVQAAGSFRKQFSIALLTAILAPLLIGAIIATALVYNDRFMTIRGIATVAEPAPAPATPAK